jgi:hypothetical protein
MIKRPTVTPVQVLESFRSGKSTADMAKELFVPEASIYKLLVIAREAQRLFHDPADPSSTALHESAVASYQRWHRLSYPEVHGVEDASDLGNSRASKRQKDYRPV